MQWVKILTSAARVMVEAWVQSLARELLYATGRAVKRKKGRKEGRKGENKKKLIRKMHKAKKHMKNVLAKRVLISLNPKV